VGAILGKQEFIFKELIERLHDKEIVALRTRHCGEDLIFVAGVARNGKLKLFFGMTFFEGKLLEGYTCAFDNVGELIDLAKAPYIPSVNFPDYVAALLELDDAFELREF